MAGLGNLNNNYDDWRKKAGELYRKPLGETGNYVEDFMGRHGFQPSQAANNEETKDNGWLGWAKDAMDSGAAGVFAGQARFGQANSPLGGETLKAGAEYLEDVVQKNARTKFQEPELSNVNYWTDPQGAWYDVNNMIGSMGALGAETLAVGAALSASPIAGAVGTAATKLPAITRLWNSNLGKLVIGNVATTPFEAISEGGNVVGQMLEEGYSEDEIQSAVNKAAGMNMAFLGLSNALQSYGATKLLGLLGDSPARAGAKEIIKKGVMGAIGGGITNAGEEAGQSAIGYAAQGKPLDLDEIIASAKAGLVGGLVLGGAGGAGGAAMAGSGQQQKAHAANPSNVVDRVRSLQGALPYEAEDGTNCMRTMGIALQDTPFEGMINVDQAVTTAEENGLLMDPENYTPQPGDMAVVNDGNHIVMVTEDGGTIQNGASQNGVYESGKSPAQMFGNVKYYIQSSIYNDSTNAAQASQQMELDEDAAPEMVLPDDGFTVDTKTEKKEGVQNGQSENNKNQNSEFGFPEEGKAQNSEETDAEQAEVLNRREATRRAAEQGRAAEATDFFGNIAYPDLSAEQAKANVQSIKRQTTPLGGFMPDAYYTNNGEFKDRQKMKDTIAKMRQKHLDQQWYGMERNRINAGLEGIERDAADFITSLHPDNPAAGLKIERERLQKQYDGMLAPVIDELKSGMKQGVEVIRPEGEGRGYRASRNAQWYSDFYKQHKRAPNQGELKQIAYDVLSGQSSALPGWQNDSTESAVYFKDSKAILDGLREQITALDTIENKMPERFNAASGTENPVKLLAPTESLDTKNSSNAFDDVAEKNDIIEESKVLYNQVLDKYSDIASGNEKVRDRVERAIQETLDFGTETGEMLWAEGGQLAKVSGVGAESRLVRSEDGGSNAGIPESSRSRLFLESGRGSDIHPLRVRNGHNRISKTLGIGITRALVNDGAFSLNGKTITSLQDLAEYAQVLRHPGYEKFHRVYVNADGRIIGHETVTSMLPSESRIFEGENMRQSMKVHLKKAKSDAVSGVYYIHNHPSSDVTPSKEDFGVTSMLAKKVGEKFKGHIVLDTTEYALIDTNGNYTKYEIPDNKQVKYDLIGMPHKALGEKLDSVDVVARAVKTLDDTSQTTAFVTDSKMKVRAVVQLPAGIGELKPEALNRYLRWIVRSNYGLRLFVSTADEKVFDHVQELVRKGRIVDAVLTKDRGISEVARQKVDVESDGTFFGVGDVTANRVLENTDVYLDEKHTNKKANEVDGADQNSRYSISDKGEELNPIAMQEWEAQAKDAFSNVKNFSRDGSVMEFDLPNGQHMRIDIVKRIILDDTELSRAQEDHGGKIEREDKVIGSIRTVGRNAFMTLTQDNVRGTIDHEALHYARTHGLAERENAALDKKFGGDEEAMAEAYRKWRIRWKELKEGSDWGKLWRKVKDFAAKVADFLGFETEHDIFRKIESGEVWERDSNNGKTDSSYKVTNSQITGETRIPVVDVTGLPKVDVNSNTVKGAIAKSLIGKTFRIIGSNGIGRVANKREGMHVIGGSNNPTRTDDARRRALSAAEDILNNSVYVEKHLDGQHGTKKRYVELYAVVKDGNNLTRFRVVAKEGNKNAGEFEVKDAKFYDIIKDGTPTIAIPQMGMQSESVPSFEERTLSERASQKDAQHQSNVPSTVSVAELLTGVKDRQGVPYVNRDGGLNYDAEALRGIKYSILSKKDDKKQAEPKDLTSGQKAARAFTNTERRVAALPITIEKTKVDLASAQEDVKSRKDIKGDKFVMELSGKRYTERAAASAAFSKLVEGYTNKAGSVVGKIGGFDLRLKARDSVLVKTNADGTTDKSYISVDAYVLGKGQYMAQTTSLQGVEHVVMNGPEKAVQTHEENLSSYEKELKALQSELEKPFEYQEKYEGLLKRQEEINKELKLDEMLAGDTLESIEVDGDEANKPDREFSIRDRASGEALTPQRVLEQAKRSIPNGKNFKLDGATVSLEMPNGRKLTINLVDEIIATPEQLKKASAEHGRAVTSNKQLQGSMRMVGLDGIVELTRDSESGTIDHEVMEFALKVALTEKQKNTLESKYKSKEEQCDAYRDWQALNKQGKGGAFGRLWRLVQNFADNVMAFFGSVEATQRIIDRNAEQVFEDVASGKVWESGGAIYKGSAAPNFSVGKSKIKRFVEAALKSKDGKLILTLGKVSKDEAEAIKANTGLDVGGYIHVWESADVRHVQKHHGIKTERNAEQAGLDHDDMLNALEAIESPNEIKKGTPTKNGEPSIRFIKNGDNGEYTVVEVVRQKNKRLAIKTMWKKANKNKEESPAKHHADNIDLQYTSENGSRQILASDNNLSPKADDVKYSAFSKKSVDAAIKGYEKQGISSADTSLMQIPAVFKKIKWVPGTVNIDLGGGKYDLATEYAKEQGVENVVFDPFNRNKKHNEAAFEKIKTKGDTATVANVLNVIAEEQWRDNVILQAAKSIKKNGIVYFSIYEGDGAGEGRVTSKGWQNNKKTSEYVAEIEQHFDEVKRKGNIIEARNPNVKVNETAVWFMGEGASSDISYSVRDDQQSDNTLTSGQKVASAFSNTERKGTVESVKDWFVNARKNLYRDWIDKNDALHDVDKAYEAERGEKLSEDEKVYNKAQTMRAHAAGTANALIEGDEESIKAVNNRLKNKKLPHVATLAMALDKVNRKVMDSKYSGYLKENGFANWIDALGSYLGSIRLLEMDKLHKEAYQQEVEAWEAKGGRGKKPVFEPYKMPAGLSEEDLRTFIRQAPQEFKAAASLYWKFNDNLLTIMEDAGMISEDLHELLNTKYRYYAPLMRDFSDTAAADSFIGRLGGIGKGIANVSSTLKTISVEGSERGIINPLESSLKAAVVVCGRAERNKVGQMAVNMAEDGSIGNVVWKAEGKTADPKNCIFTVMENGVKVAYQTIPELYGPIAGYNEVTAGFVLGIARNSARLLRAGATSSPSFIVRNLIRDTFFAAISSKTGFIPIVDTARGIYALITNPQLRAEFEAAGVNQFNYYGSSEAVAKSLDDMAGGKDYLDYGAGDIWRAFTKYFVYLSDLSESGTRMGEFMRARKQGVSIDEAARYARELTLDFSRSGVQGEKVNQIVPFFNACLQGGDKMIRLLKDNPVGTTTNLAKYIILPSVLLWVLNHDEDWYKELDPNIKNTCWCLPGGIRIPKPQEAGIFFGSGVETFLDMAFNSDPEAVGAWCEAVKDAAAPNFVPTLFLPMLEWQANYSYFRGQPITGKRLERLPDELQYNTGTSEVAKAIGSALKVSPVKIDNTIRGYTGTMGMFMTQSLDALIAEKRNMPTKKVSEWTFIRDFTLNDNIQNRSVNDFYDMLAAANEQHAGYGVKGKPIAAVKAVRKAGQLISDANKDIRNITTSASLTPDEKRNRIDKKKAYIRNVAKMADAKFSKYFK